MGKYLGLALNKANELSTKTHRQRLYAIVTDKRGKILGEGGNSFTKTSPMTWMYGCKSGNMHKTHTHAEILSIVRAARVGGKPYAIYVARALKNTKGGLSMPCPACRFAIEEAGIKKIFYIGNNEEEVVECLK